MAKEAAEKAAREAVDKAATEAADKAAKDAGITEALEKDVIEKAAKAGAEKPARDAAEKAALDAAGKGAAEKEVREAADQAAKKAADEAAEKAAKEQADKIVECKAIHTAYKALGTAQGCKKSTTQADARAKIAVLTAVIAGRTSYLAKRCDYILAGSIKRGSATAERGHNEQLTGLTGALNKCLAKLPTLPP